jgi:hypothetical protein
LPREYDCWISSAWPLAVVNRPASSILGRSFPFYHPEVAAVETALTLTLQSEYPAANATGTDMAQTVTIDRPSVAKPVSGEM